MPAVEVALDATLAVGVVILAAAALWSRGAFASVVFFIALGLMMALAWTRLDAPDVALAEAAIGAGLSGALLLDSVAELGWDRPRDGGR